LHIHPHQPTSILANIKMIFPPRAIMSILTAHIAALAVSSTSNKVLAENINLDHAMAGSASGSPRSTRTDETQGAECAVVASPETREKDAGFDVGILLTKECKENEVCVGDDTSSLGGRCAMFGAKEGVTKAHRDLAGACSGTYPGNCIECTMQDGAAGKKCDGYDACDFVDTSKVSCGSCNGQFACFNADGPIGESSCNGSRSCVDAGGPIGESSCNGVYACFNQICEFNSYSTIEFANLAQDVITFTLQHSDAIGSSSW
jgi:hypothetical protein